MFTVGVFALIFDGQGRILLCHRRDYDLWNLPGGQLEEGESPWEGLALEVREEIGVEAAIERLVGVYSKPDVHEVVLSFVCRTRNGEPSCSDEVDRLAYFAVDELPPNTVPKQVERIQDAVKGDEQPTLKVQRGPSAIDLLKDGKL